MKKDIIPGIPEKTFKLTCEIELSTEEYKAFRWALHYTCSDEELLLQRSAYAAVEKLIRECSNTISRGQYQYANLLWENRV